ncbi:MAG: hypothetical protein ACRC1L_09015, partial [Prochlorococcaceae cyanobacterium]
MSMPVEKVPVEMDPVELKPVEIWAPGLDGEPVAAALSAARLPVRECSTLEQAGGEGPLLLVYGDPLTLLPLRQLPGYPGDSAAAAEGAVQPYQSLLAAIPGLEQGPRPWRLVNLACLCPPALVAWCVQPYVAPPQPEVTYGFAQPDALDALVAVQWLEEQPQLLMTYLSLERHPAAAALDHRP